MDRRKAKQKATSAAFVILSSGSPSWGDGVSDADWSRLDDAWQELVDELGCRVGAKPVKCRVADPDDLNRP